MSIDQGGNAPEDRPIRKPPARTSRRRAQQITMAAQDLLMKRIEEDRASPTEVVAAVRLASELETANLARIKAQTELLVAQRAKAESEMLNSQMMEDAMKAISEYRGDTNDT